MSIPAEHNATDAPREVPGRVLYAEDDPGIQAVAKVALGQLGGYDLLICNSGEELLEAFADFAPDLVLLDFMMPGMDGLQTLQQLQRRPDARHTPVIFITARGQAADVNQIMQAGALGIIQKPFDPMTLGSRINKLWKQHQASQQQSQQVFDNHIEQLRRLYVEQLPELSEQLAEAWSRLHRGQGTSLVNSSFHQQVHKLAGSAGMYGLLDVSQAAHQVETILQAAETSAAGSSNNPSDIFSQSLEPAWHRLQTCLQTAVGQI